MTLAVGFFDGVHLGHQAILAGADAALTFKTHPLDVISPARAPRLIMNAADRLAAIRACGVRDIRMCAFTPAFAALSPEEFLARIDLRPGTRIRCGANWRFGRGGTGDAAFLRARGFEVEIVPYVLYAGESISSTRIRAALERGEIEDATAMLGRPFVVRGMRVSGKGEGARLGFPTLNLSLEGLNILLPRGVYAVDVGGTRAVANWGVAPTFGDRAWKENVLEVHFPGGIPEAKDPAREVRLLRFLRPERRFASAEELASQIARDCAEAMR